MHIATTEHGHGPCGGPGVEALSDAELEDWLSSGYGDAQHAIGPCRMGATDGPRMMVDTECRVLGCTGPCTADASIMPEVPTASTRPTPVAIAERMAGRPGAAA
ncbi:GMC oxidoreductase [Teichococcus aestuarii]|uniref:GMC oxidoreductase n=1 Tax=Teichococcus aestuarii TaxID=568898 RepID=UPI00362394E5